MTNKTEAKVDDGLAAKVRKLEEKLEKTVKSLERILGIDVDRDGKIGSARVFAMIAIFVLSILTSVFAAENEVVRYIAAEGNDAVLTIEADEGDDAADELQLIMKAGGTGAISVGGTEVITLSTTGSSSATVAATDAITLTDSDSNAVVTITGFEASDASVVLDADQGDDNADTWTVKSAASDNDLDFINHTTTGASLSSDGLLSVLVGIDAIGAVDLDYGSADVTDHTFVSDGGTVIVDGEVTVDGKWATVGGDATTALMIQKKNITATNHALQTNAFDVVFGAAPTVVCTYTEDPGDVRPIFVTSVTASNMIVNITADKNYGYIAIGTRP